MLTKSLFKLAVECPTKIYYKINNYPSKSANDEFLKALASGGYQVGELARCFFPDGILIEKSEISGAVSQTNDLLERENVIIFEASFKYNNFFVKADILIKEGNEIKIYEVKSKSIERGENILNIDGKPNSDWKKYLYDLAFQKYVISNVLPGTYTMKFYLYLLNKDSKTSVDLLNQKFVIKYFDNQHKVVKVGDCSPSSLGVCILIEKEFTEIINNIVGDQANKDFAYLTFENFIKLLSDKITNNERVVPSFGRKCKTCEFKTEDTLSGFSECWQSIFTANSSENEKNIIYNIWDYRNVEKNFNDSKYFMSQLDLNQFSNSKERQKRQLLQVKSVLNNSTEEIIDIEGLRSEFEKWIYPLHMIDFETSRVALPFLKEKHPYQIIAFQFSHHTIEDNWTIEHKGEFLKTSVGEYPNFEFLRQLKNQLDTDHGSVFMYHHYERDVLNSLKEELKNCSNSEVSDKEELIDWIETLTVGDRSLVDLLVTVKKYYYNPRMEGSNSLKVVLPAILNSSDELKEKYKEPIYGTDKIKSNNFKDHKWIVFNEKGEVNDPYQLLEKFEYDLNETEEDRIFTAEGIYNGGAAMIAYNQLQFTEMNEKERKRINKALLQYCELDTFAMVLLLEFWKSKINQ